MLKRMVDAGIDTIRIAEDADENSPIIKMLQKILPIVMNLL